MTKMKAEEMRAETIMKISMNNIYRKNRRPDEKGFTILEFIIYFTLTVFILAMVIQMAINVTVGKEKLRAQQEVNRSGRAAIDTIVNAIIESDEVVGTSGEDD